MIDLNCIDQKFSFQILPCCCTSIIVKNIKLLSSSSFHFFGQVCYGMKPNSTQKTISKEFYFCLPMTMFWHISLFLAFNKLIICHFIVIRSEKFPARWILPSSTSPGWRRARSTCSAWRPSTTKANQSPSSQMPPSKQRTLSVTFFYLLQQKLKLTPLF